MQNSKFREIEMKLSVAWDFGLSYCKCEYMHGLLNIFLNSDEVMDMLDYGYLVLICQSNTKSHKWVLSGTS